MILLAALENLTEVIAGADLQTLVGIAIFATWLLHTSLGREALVDSPSRRNCLPLHMPLLVFGVWALGGGLVVWAIGVFMGPVDDLLNVYVENLAYYAHSAVIIALILVVARHHFARGLRGFGLRGKTIPKDFAAAFVTWLAVWPLMAATILITAMIARLIAGDDFTMPQHEGLEVITTTPERTLQWLVAFSAVVIAPVVEELLFRGLFQTTVRSYLGRPWPAIFVASAVFASVHANRSHWPALFVLALGLGYTYEKSGSLYRPILMHAVFNGMTIAATLTE